MISCNMEMSQGRKCSFDYAHIAAGVDIEVAAVVSGEGGRIEYDIRARA